MVHIQIFHKRWSLILGSFLTVSILKYNHTSNQPPSLQQSAPSHHNLKVYFFDYFFFYIYCVKTETYMLYLLCLSVCLLF